MSKINKIISVSGLATIANTGDILLCACQKENNKTFSGKMAAAFSGNSDYKINTSNLDIIHSVVIIKDPPTHVLQAHGINSTNKNNREKLSHCPVAGSDLYVLESNRKTGCKLKPFTSWVTYVLTNPSWKDTKILYRSLEQDYTQAEHQQIFAVNENEIWKWLVKAAKLPYYTVWGLEAMSVGHSYFVTNKDSFWMTFTTFSDIVADECTNFFTHMQYGVQGVRQQHRFIYTLIGMILRLIFHPLAFLYFAMHFVITIIVHFDQLLSMRYFGPVRADGKKNDLFLNAITQVSCSRCVAITLMVAGILSGRADSSWYLPKDFIGLKDGLLDKNLASRYQYSLNILEIEMDPSPANSSPPANKELLRTNHLCSRNLNQEQIRVYAHAA